MALADDRQVGPWNWIATRTKPICLRKVEEARGAWWRAWERAAT